jgi:two-component system OmpR family response regulator
MKPQLVRSPVPAGQKQKRVLVVEDDDALGRVLCDSLIIEGFAVERASDGGEATRIATAFHPDLVLLDVMLPDTTGFELFGALRRRGATAIIVLTARGQKSDKLRGLNLGADDYVTKPFDIDELLARVHAVLRRARTDVEILALGEVTIDFGEQRIVRRGRSVPLSRRECELVRYLAERRDRVVYRDELLREVWGYPESPMTRSVDHAIARLRKKIEIDPHRPRFIHTVHGNGYCLTLGGGSVEPGSEEPGPA